MLCNISYDYAQAIVHIFPIYEKGCLDVFVETTSKLQAFQLPFPMAAVD